MRLEDSPAFKPWPKPYGKGGEERMAFPKEIYIKEEDEGNLWIEVSLNNIEDGEQIGVYELKEVKKAVVRKQLV